MKFPRIPVVLAIALILMLAACAPATAPEPAKTAPDIVCPMRVTYQFSIRDTDANNNEMYLWEFATAEFSLYPTVEEDWNGYEYFAWYMTAQSRADFEAWYDDAVSPVANDIRERIDDAFAVEGITTPTASLNGVYLENEFATTADAVCPDEPFAATYTLDMGTPDARRYFTQVDVNDGYVTFVFQTPGYTEGVKGSVMQAKMPLATFVAIVKGELKGDPSRPVEAMTLDYGSYSEMLTAQVYGARAVEYASFSMLPEDQLAHDVIYEYIRRFASWNNEPAFVFINTLVNDDDGARLIGSLIGKK